MTDKKIILIPTAALVVLMILEIIAAVLSMTELVPIIMLAAGAVEIIEIACALILFKKWGDTCDYYSENRQAHHR